MVEEVWLTQPLNDAGRPRSSTPSPTGSARSTPTAPTRCSGAGAPRTRSGCCRSSPTSAARWCAPAIALIRGTGAAAASRRCRRRCATTRASPTTATTTWPRMATTTARPSRSSRARSPRAESLGEPFRWAAWRAQIVRWLMREGRARGAYASPRATHLVEHVEFYADLEWLAGYMALRYLDEPETALPPLPRLRGGGRPAPISSAAPPTGRAAPWRRWASRGARR